jgi:hypothetical protein
MENPPKQRVFYFSSILFLRVQGLEKINTDSEPAGCIFSGNDLLAIEHQRSTQN